MYCLYHNADLDGHCSGALIKLRFPECHLIGIDYGNDIDIQKFKDETVYMVDFSLEPWEKTEELASICKRFIWIDHHISAIKKAEESIQKRTFNAEGIFADGMAACELTWSWLYPKDKMPEFVYLIGRWDVWDHEVQFGIKELQYGIKMYETDPSLNMEIWTALLIDSTRERKLLAQTIHSGIDILKYTKQQNKFLANKVCFTVVVEDHLFLAANIANQNSMFFEHADQFDMSIFEGVLTFSKQNDSKWKISLYSNPHKSSNVDFSVIAKKYGGGGHKGAAGWTTNILPDFLL